MFICRSRVAVAPPPVVVAGVTIPYLSKVCDLGMTLSDRLTFDDHINDLCSRVHYSMRNLWSASEYISSKLKQRLVKALVIPQFLFGDVLFRMADCNWSAQTWLLSIIVYGLFMACGVTLMSLIIAEIFWAVVFLNTLYFELCNT
jgi:hypothetical protein